MNEMKILIIDPNEKDRISLRNYLNKQNYDVLESYGGNKTPEIIKDEKIDLVISALRLPEINGLELLKGIKKDNPELPVIIVSEAEDVKYTVEAMRQGAYDYIEKPLKLDRFKYVIKKALETRRLGNNLDDMRYFSDDLFDNNIIGKSPKIKEILKKIGQITSNKITVLIQGESGTGKELISKAIHYSGITKDFPFVAVNSAALPETLLESELFGHEKGAFTGAIKEKKGKFELAGEGTIFLDEISEISPTIQTKLLRVLQEKEFERVGGEKTISMNARIIVATNKNLEDLVAQGKFRQDLYYRIKVFTINVPPLRERVEDIPALVIHFLEKINKELHKNVRKVPYDVIDLLQHYSWVGNVRELENTLMQAVVLAKGDVLEKENILLSKDHRTKDADTQDLKLDTVIKDHIRTVLEKVNWDKKHAAKLLKISRQTLYNKIKYYSLSRYE